jgi:hypothetical protein
MLKRIGLWKYAIPAVVIIGVSVFVSCQDQNTRDEYEAKCNQLNSRAASPAAHHENCDEGAENAARHLPRWYRIFSWPEGITTWAILFTLFVIAEQTAQTKKAADAAFLNAQAVINAERPWLLVVIKPVMGPMGGFNVHIRNRGRTPAMITNAQWGCIAVKEVTDLPREPSYWPRELVKDRIVMPDGAARIWWFDYKTLHNVLKEQFPRFSWEGRVFVFGTILYRDLADPSPSALHETRWIGLYQSGNSEELGDSIFRIEGIGVADEYHRYT